MKDCYILTKNGKHYLVESQLTKVGLNSYHRPIYKREILLQLEIPQDIDALVFMQQAKQEGLL